MLTAPAPMRRATRLNGVLEMDKGPVEGAAKSVSGKVKESVGGLTGDQKTIERRRRASEQI